jgi:hypothetical protein
MRGKPVPAAGRAKVQATRLVRGRPALNAGQVNFGVIAFVLPAVAIVGDDGM